MRVFTAGFLGLILAFSIFGGGAPTGALAQGSMADKGPKEMSLPPVMLYQSMLKINKKSGWVQFRNFSGKQIVYFSSLQALHCRLKEIRYSINSSDLDKRFDLVKCNPQLPFSLSPNPAVKDIALTMALKTAKSVAVQVVWEDDSMSEALVFRPCIDAGDQTCAVLVE